MPRILIVDDDQAVLRATTIMLEANGFDVITVADGPAAIEALKAWTFDAAVVDLFMPGMDGLKTTEALHAAVPSLPIIAASGFLYNSTFGSTGPAMPNFDPMAKQAGAVAAVYKPFRPADLLRALETAIAAPAKNQVV
jgi:CheY-like chemotaxis protein